MLPALGKVKRQRADERLVCCASALDCYFGNMARAGPCASYVTLWVTDQLSLSAKWLLPLRLTTQDVRQHLKAQGVHIDEEQLRPGSQEFLAA